MESKSLVICDPEDEYAQSLAFYILNRREIHFQVHVCSGIQHVKDVDILLISDVYPQEEIQKIKADRILILTGGMSDFERKDVIYKYQPGEKILEEILTQCEEIYTGRELFFSLPHKKKGKLIGVFSPVHRVGKTTYALKLGERLADSENVLYLNLELYGGLGGHFERGGQTLEDVLYYARQEKGNLGFILTKAVKHRGKLDYILPVPVSEDIKSIRGTEWIELLSQILSQSMYETIILDIDEGIQDVYELLKVCTKVHVLTDDSVYSQAKMEQFERELSLLGYQEVLEKIERKEDGDD